MKNTTGNARNTARVLALLLGFSPLALVCGITGCAGDRYTQSTGESIDDRATTSRVRKALSEDAQYKYGDINVQTFKGVVQLSGFVNSRDQKNRAGDLARKVAGVKSVENNIIVKESAN